MQGLAQRCDDPSQSDFSQYGTVLERAQYDGVMREIVKRLRMLPATHAEEVKSAADRVYCSLLRRTWSYGNEMSGLPAEVPHISIALDETRSNERRCGYVVNSERMLERLVLTLKVNKDSFTDEFKDAGEKESSYDMPGERYRWHDVGRWRGYSPGNARIAQVVLAALAAPEESATHVTNLESKVA